MLSTGIELEEELKRIFGYNDFRQYQKEIITGLMAGRDTVAILPTGAGKSICYQLPAMLMEGTALVISPLISLMQDQVISLSRSGVPAAFINSSLRVTELRQVMENLSSYKLLYIAPERLTDESFLERLKNLKISFFAIDEAHCISQWGHSFRPEYRQLNILKKIFPDKPVIALTATATPKVEEDIAEQLDLKNTNMIKGSFDRPNLSISVDDKSNSQTKIINFVKKNSQQSGIIYSGTRKGVDEMCGILQNEGIDCQKYHAGMSAKDREKAQHDFVYDKVQLICATVAFGMGVHKPNIRYVIHMDMPKCIEQYYQEIGRAGRDGMPSQCLLFYSGKDLSLNRFFASQIENPQEQEHALKLSYKMYNLCTSFDCRRKLILAYFGEHYPKSHCNSCDNCCDEKNQIDGSIITKKILSCVFRMEQRFGIRQIAQVLIGSKTANVCKHNHDELSTFGIMPDATEEEIRDYVYSLISMGFLKRTEDEYPVIQWTDNTRSALDGEHKITFHKREKKAYTKAKVVSENPELYEKLRELRLKLAKKENVPPYVIFSDKTLNELAKHRPSSQEEFLEINGVGPYKWRRYGRQFLNAVQRAL
jgi:ATP-dependent DNA helicase RecQ